jgi:branched-chain amino acid transport system substrate-binding protein
MRTNRRNFMIGAAGLPTLVAFAPAFAKGKYDTGATIKIGNTIAYSGPASSYGVIGTCIGAYWTMVNDRGGINGRKIVFESLDDGYSPPKTVEVTRQLVEQDNVFCIFNGLGTPTNTAVHKYLNDRKVPQLFVATGASKWGDPKHFPWTMGFQPDYHTEAVIYARHILANVKDAKIAVLMQNDDYGKDYFAGFTEGLGKQAGRIVKHVTYEVTDPTVDSQVIELSGSGANVFFNIAIPPRRRSARQPTLAGNPSSISTTCRPRSPPHSCQPDSTTVRASSPACTSWTRPTPSGTPMPT